jgi:catechol 2,3-dioxygenase-like lactoylglutathione lyase family enzyme
MLQKEGLRIELFEFSRRVSRVADLGRPVCDYGISHFCIEVSDIEGMYHRLRAAGVSFHCPPLKFSGRAYATYGRDPDGNVFELLEPLPNNAQSERVDSRT